MKTIYLQTWARVQIQPTADGTRFEVVSAEHPTNEELTTRLYDAGTMPLSEDGGLLDKTTFEPFGPPGILVDDGIPSSGKTT